MITCLHFIWLQGTHLIPERFRSNLASWQAFADYYGHSLKIWDTPAITKNYLAGNEQLEALYRSYPIFVQRADMGRYLILRGEGGIYLDIDTSIQPWQWEAFQQKLVEVPPDKVAMPPPRAVPYLGVAPLDALVRNWLIYVPRPGHPLFQALLDEMLVRADRRPTHLRCYYVAYSTGSVLITDVLYQLGPVRETWWPLDIHHLMHNEYASTWGGTFYYDQQDWILILGLVIVIIAIILMVWFLSKRTRTSEINVGIANHTGIK